MIRMTVFDLRNIFSTSPWRVLLALGLIVVIGLTAPVQGAAILVGGYVGAILLTYMFLTDERGRLDALYGLSHVSRTSVVIGRYATALIVGAFTSVFGFVVALVIDAVQRARVEWPVIGLMSLAAFAVAAVSLGVLLPWYFAMGYARGRQAMLVLVLAFAGLAWFAGRTPLFDDPAVGLSAVGDMADLTVITVASGLVVLAISAMLAARLYRRRSL